MHDKNVLRSSLLKFESELENNFTDFPMTEMMQTTNQTSSMQADDKDQKITKSFTTILSTCAEQTKTTSEVTQSTQEDLLNDALPVKICVVGIGGAGNNVINSMTSYTGGLNSIVKKYALNTDQQHLLTLKNLNPNERILIRSDKTRGRGSGGDPAIGEKATCDFENGIKNLLKGSDLCIIVAGLGKGTGTGGGPIVAQIARKLGCTTIALLITPSNDDGDGQFKKSRISLRNFTSVCDAISLISNDSIVDKENTSIAEARNMINRTICTTIDSIVDTIATPSTQNIDFADLKAFIQRTNNVNELLHLQLNLFDTNPNDIASKLQSCLEHNLYGTSIERISKVLIQFNVTNKCDIRVVQSIFAEIKNLSKSSELDIVTGMRYIQGNEPKNIEIFFVRPYLATSNRKILQHDEQPRFNDVNYNSVTLSNSNSDMIRTTNNQFVSGTKARGFSMFGTNNPLITDEDFDTDKMTAVLKTVLPKHHQKSIIFDDDLLSFKEAKFKN